MSIDLPSKKSQLLSDSRLPPRNGRIDDKLDITNDNLSIINAKLDIRHSNVDIINNDPESEEWETQAERFERRVSENLDSLRAIGEGFLEDILRLVGNIDKLILACERFLYKSQPPSSGRIRVSWELYENQRYHPVIVRWVKTRNNKWRYERLSRPTSAVSVKGGFKTHRDEVLDTVKLVQQLISHRNDVLGYMKNLGRGVTQKDRVITAFEDTVLLTLVELVNSVNSKGVVKLNIDELLAG
jgi:hypothetical protein